MIIGALFISYLWTDPYFFFAAAFLVVFSICCHEFMHAYTALRCGDPTAADAGHLTLNPLKQMGWWSLGLFAFFGIAWGAVPVNPGNLRSKGGRVAVSAAGPLTNLVLALFFLLVTYTLRRLDAGTPEAWTMLFYGCILNIVLFILNMLPLPGLDGFAVAAEFFPQLTRVRSEAGVAIFFILMILLFAGFDKLFAAAAWLGNHGLMLLRELFG